MTTQFDFSNDQWTELATLPVLVGMAVAKAEDSGRIGNFREGRALMASLGADDGTGAAAALIEQAAATDTSDELESLKDATPETVAAEAEAMCRRVADFLGAVARPEEAADFKRWILDTGRQVAEAAKEHGVRVSPPEAAILDRIRAALAI